MLVPIFFDSLHPAVVWHEGSSDHCPEKVQDVYLLKLFERFYISFKRYGGLLHLELNSFLLQNISWPGLQIVGCDSCGLLSK